MKFPDFIIIGAPKCGTTALWYNLDKHPDIQMALRSKSSVEFHFWGFKHWNKGLDWYKKHFKNDKLCGEKSVSYWSSNKALRLMKKHIPNVKLILCIRNPVDRAYSNFQMHKKVNKISNFDMNTFVSRYAGQGRYIQNIQNKILKFFDKNQLYICVAEHMKKNTKDEMAKIFNFLGVDDLGYNSKEVHGVLLEKRSRQEDVALSQKQSSYRVWTRHKEVLIGSLRNEIINYYKPLNQKLYDFLGYKIKEWDR